MKKLVCEMCGSTDLIKQDGVFVCQSCGCKYSVEEARKMMVEVEGTVEVSGTVKVDDTSKVDNYLDLSNTAYSAGNGQSAFDYANKALEIAPQNSKAWIAKMKAVEYIGTFGDLKLMEVVEAGKNAVAFADEAQKQNTTFEVYNYEVTRALSLLKLSMNKMNETADIENTFKRFCRISLLTAGQNTLNADSKVVNLYDNVAKEAVSLVLLIPNEVLIDFPEISRIIGECAKQYQLVTDALIKRYAIYGASLNDAALKGRKSLKSLLEEKCNNALKDSEEKMAKEQAERNEQYWQKHIEEKEQLLQEKSDINNKLEKLSQAIASLPEMMAFSNIESQITELEERKNSLGIFKNKEKKALQDQINNLEKECTSARIVKDEAVAPMENEIKELKNRLEDIENELTKNR